MKLKVVFMGTPEFGAIVLEKLIGQLEVISVYTRPDRPAGRGLRPTPPPVKKIALKYNLQVHQPTSLKKPQEWQRLKELSPQVIIVAAYGLILPREVLSIPSYGCINIHPSLLPKYRGPAPVQWALLCGEEISGVSIMLMDEGVDSGPVIAQEKSIIQPEDDAGTLTRKLAELGAELLLKVLKQPEKLKEIAQPQEHSLATFSRLIKKEEGELDFSLPALKLWHKVRAFNPHPGAYTFWKGKRLKIIKAFPLPEEVSELPGRVRMVGGRCVVETSEGILELREIQLEGKKALPIKEFLCGARDFVGSRLPS